MDLELLRTFLEVDRTRHFGNAGDNLNLTQAAVSARIKLLESQLGTRLFVRRYKDLQLTAEGHRLTRHADILLSGWRKARQEVLLGGSNAQITIGGSLRLWDVALQNWFHAVRRQRPELGIITESHGADQLTRRLLDGLLDIVFMLEPPQLETLQVKEVANVELVLVCARPDQSVEQAVGEGYLMVDWGLTHGLEHRRLFPDAPEPQVRVSQAKMALEHLLAVGGSAYLPVRMVSEAVKQSQLHVVPDAPTLERTAHAVFPLRSEKLELIDEILDLFEYSVSLPKAAR